MERDDRYRRGRRRFRIEIDGRLTPGFAESLDGVDQQDSADGTTLSGEFIDQSQLHGILDHLRGLGIDVRRFEIER
jgi:hypothetical protein